MEIILHNYIPPPCQRPRLGKGGHAYSPSAKPEQSLAWMMLSELNRQNIARSTYQSPCRIDVLIYHDPKHPPKGDLDNILKFIMDAAQKAQIISNDKLFRSLHIDSYPSLKVVTVIKINMIMTSQQFCDSLDFSDKNNIPRPPGCGTTEGLPECMKGYANA